jgi:hypothetical protein
MANEWRSKGDGSQTGLTRGLDGTKTGVNFSAKRKSPGVSQDLVLFFLLKGYFFLAAFFAAFFLGAAFLTAAFFLGAAFFFAAFFAVAMFF